MPTRPLWTRELDKRHTKMPHDELGRLIDWKLARQLKSCRTEGDHMQRQFTIELRVDYERGGVARTLRYRIVEDDGPAASPMLAAPRSR